MHRDASCCLRDEEAAGSNPATPTGKRQVTEHIVTCPCITRSRVSEFWEPVGSGQRTAQGTHGPRRLLQAPGGFTVAEHAARVRQITGHDDYTIRQAAYDLRKLRGRQLVDKPGRTRRYHVPRPAARTLSALLTLRNHVIAPILAGVRSPRMGRKPRIWTAADRDYETLRIGMQTLFRHVGIETQTAAA